jgi:hypothetical protein
MDFYKTEIQLDFCSVLSKFARLAVLQVYTTAQQCWKNEGTLSRMLLRSWHIVSEIPGHFFEQSWTKILENDKDAIILYLKIQLIMSF